MTSIHPHVPKRSTIPTLAALTLLLLLVSTIVGNAAPAPYELTSKQLSDFRRDGVIVVRGMLSGERLQNAVAAAHTIQRKQSWGQRLVYKLFPSYRNLEFQTYRKHAAFKTVAFDSTAPTICAKLMGLDDEENGQQGDTTTSKPRSLRLLKEAVLGFSRGDTGCGWHVDDKTFWPSEDSHEDNNKLVDKHKRSQHQRRREAGINVWITLSPVTAKEGGGLAVALGSHNLTGKGRAGKVLQKARRAIASKGAQTQCILDKIEPSCHNYMERNKRVYDLQPGDAIIHDRYVFHRADAFHEGLDDDDKAETEDVTKQRISLRYMPSDATFFNTGHRVDAVAQRKQLQTGDPLWKAGEYFPQVWPSQLAAEAQASPQRDTNPFGGKVLVKIAKIMLTPKPKAK